MLKKLFIVPYCGDLPAWYDQYVANTKVLGKFGFDWLVITDMEDFKNRVRRVLGVEPIITPGTIKMAEFHPAMGLLYQEELKGYDFWGYTDLDVVYGRLDRFVSDNFLSDCDIYGNDPNAMCGPFSLLRNCEKVNELFKRKADWKEIFSAEKIYAFDEIGFTEVVRAAKDIRFKSGHWLDNDKTLFDLTTKDDMLFNCGKETMMFHFKETKKYPEIKTI